MITIVTDKCYIQADQVRHVQMEECPPEFDHLAVRAKLRGQRASRKNAIKTPKLSPLLRTDIKIYYSWIDTTNNRQDERYCEVTIYDGDRSEARRIYKEIIEQIRNQSPDNMMMDDLINKYLLEE